MRDYVATLTSPATIADDIRHVQEHVAEHKCAAGQAVEWRCDPVPGLGFQLYASWPCDGDE